MILKKSIQVNDRFDIYRADITIHLAFVSYKNGGQTKEDVIKEIKNGLITDSIKITSIEKGLFTNKYNCSTVLHDRLKFNSKRALLKFICLHENKNDYEQFLIRSLDKIKVKNDNKH